MKLQEVYKETFDEFKAIRPDCELLDKLKNHIQAVKESHEYKRLNVRIAWDIMYWRIGSSKMCDWYRKYDYDGLSKLGFDDKKVEQDYVVHCSRDCIIQECKKVFIVGENYSKKFVKNEWQKI